LSNYLNELENEAIYIFREVAAQFERPVLLFSGGKDSITLVHLAIKAFKPALPPFALLHIDTGHNFPEALAFRDELVKETGLQLIVRKVADTINLKGITEIPAKLPSRNKLQTITLLDAIEEFGFDACIGGARRDEEKARAKERIFSVRNAFGQWEPKLQRPELWNNFNGKMQSGQHIRVFPISNFTELDVWQYIYREKIALPSIYFAHEREVLEYNGLLVAINEFIKIEETDKVYKEKVRYRTVGDMTCTAAISSKANTIEAIIEELMLSNISERGETRIDDRFSEAAMEDRKIEGYF